MNNELETIKLEGTGKIFSKTTVDGKPYHFTFLKDSEKDIPAFIWQEDFNNFNDEIRLKIEDLVQSQKLALFTVYGFYREGRGGYTTPSFTIKKIENIEEDVESGEGEELEIF